MKVELPLGDVVDRISILCIKSETLTDPGQRDNVARELSGLRAAWATADHPDPEQLDAWPALHAVNRELWDVEDALRDHESRERFGEDFVALARSVYRLNDQRAALKRAINQALGSALVEEKSYTHS